MRNLRRSCVIALAVACGLLTASALLSACSDDPTSEPAPTADPIEVSVEGAVADTTGAMIEGAGVTVYPGGSNSALDETTTGEDGSYALSFTVEENDAPDALRLTFSAEGYAPEEATIDFAASITYNAELTPEGKDDNSDDKGDDENGDDPDSTEATVSGTVIDANTDGAIEGATITSTAGGAELFTNTTAADGTYEATFPVADEPTEITVTATAEGYEEGQQTIAFAEEMTADFQLEPVDTSTEATISGTVNDGEAGDPVEAATVKGKAQGTELFSATTAADGSYVATFTVEDEPSEITVTATAEGFEDAEETIPFAESMTAHVALQPVDTSTEATISGVVTDGETGDPVGAVTVKGEAQGTELFSAITAADGSYAATFTVEEEPVELTVTTTAEGYEEAQQTVAFGEEMTADFQLQPVDTTTEASISGTVTDEDTGDPIEGASVTGEAEGADLFTATTAADGSYAATFTVEDELGEITLTASTDDYEEAQQTIAFAVEMTSDLQLTRILDEFTITASVVNADGEPVESITVMSDEPDLAGTTGPGGQVTFTYTEVPGLPEITLTHTDPGDLYEDASVSISANADVSYSATLADVLVEATASGTVTDNEGAPIEGVTVTFAQSELGIDASTTTGTGGAYTLALGEIAQRNLGGFQMEATAAAEGYESATAMPTLEESISQVFTLVSLTQTVTFTVSPRQITTGEVISNAVYAQPEGEEEQLWPVTGQTATVTLDVQPGTYIELGIPDDQKLANNISNAINVYNKNRPGPIIDAHGAIASRGPKINYSIGDPYEPAKVNSNDINGESLELGVLRHNHIVNGKEIAITDASFMGPWWTNSGNQTFGFNSGEQNKDTMRVVIPTYNRSNPSQSLDDYLLNTAEEATHDVMNNIYFPYTITYVDSPDELEPLKNTKNTQIIYHEFSGGPSNGTTTNDEDIWVSGRVYMTISPQSISTYRREINESFTITQNPSIHDSEGNLNTSMQGLSRFKTQAKPGTTIQEE